MSEQEIYEKLNGLFQQIFDDDEITVTADTTATDVPGWDSFNNVRLMIAVEARFGIRLTTTEIEEFDKVGDLAGVIARKVGG